MAKRTSYQWLYLLGYLLFFGIIWYSVRNISTTSAPKQVPYSEFLSDLKAGDVSDVHINQTTMVGTLKPEAAKKNRAKGDLRGSAARNR